LRKRDCLKSPVRKSARRDLSGGRVGNCPPYRDVFGKVTIKKKTLTSQDSYMEPQIFRMKT